MAQQEMRFTESVPRAASYGAPSTEDDDSADTSQGGIPSVGSSTIDVAIGDVHDADKRFSTEETRKFEASLGGKALMREFFLIALLYMWPYQTLSQAQNFFILKFPTRAGVVGNAMMNCTTWPFLITHVSLTFSGLSRQISYTCKMTMPGVCIVFIAAYLIAALMTEQNEDLLLTSLYVAAACTSIAEGVTEPAVYDMAGLYPSALTSLSVQSGNGASGLVVSCVNILTRLMTTGVKPITVVEAQSLTYVFFGLMACSGIGVPAIYMLKMRRTDYFKIYVSKEQGMLAPGRDDSECDDPAEELTTSAILKATREAAAYVWPSLLTIVITFWTSLTLWPVLPGRACLGPAAAESTLSSWWFDLILLTFNVADLIGKSESRTLRWGARVLSPASQLMCSVVRACVFFPLIMTAAAPQAYDPRSAKWVCMVGVFLLGLSNGWLSTVCFMRGPKALPPGTRNAVAEQASTLLVIGLFFGISFGCLSAYQLAVGPLRDSLGKCYDAAAP